MAFQRPAKPEWVARVVGRMAASMRVQFVGWRTEVWNWVCSLGLQEGGLWMVQIGSH